MGKEKLPKGLEGIDLSSLDPRVKKIVCSDLPKSHALTMGLFGEVRSERRPAQFNTDGPRSALEAQKQL